MKDQLSIHWFKEIDSTNSEALRHIPELDNLTVIVAECQTAGRGQRGNRWLSPKCENLTFSMVLKYGDDAFSPIPAKNQFEISICSTLGLVDYLESKGIECKIKWPNDIYVHNRKICGMLVENSLSGQYLSSSVIGIGLNVNQKIFQPELLNPTSMALLTGDEYVLTDEIVSVCEFIKARLLKIGTQRDEYVARLYRAGSFHSFRDCRDDRIFEGRIDGISESGCLIVTNKEGKLSEFAFKEISYII